VIKDYWLNDDELLLTRYTDIVTGPELIDSALHTSGDERFDRVRYILSDWSDVKKVHVSPEEIKALVACLRPISTICPRAKMGSLVNPDPAGNALVAWYKFLADDLSWEVDIFTGVEEAVKWNTAYRDYFRKKIC